MLPDDRRELWLLGLGLGLCADAGLLLAAVSARWPLTADTLPLWAGTAVSVTTLGLFGLPLAVYGLRGAWAAFWTIRQTRDAWQHRNDAPEVTTAPLEPVNDESDDVPDYTPAWRAEAHRFVTAGALYGFQVRVLAAGEHQVIGWDEWSDMVGLLIDAGVLVSRGGTRWAPDWGWARWQAEGATLPLPRMRTPPPEVLLTVNAQQKQRQQQAQRPSEGVEAV